MLAQQFSSRKPRPMPLIDRVEPILISAIQVNRNDRQRREVKTDGLRESIARNGLLQPIVVDVDELAGTYVLIAGERRLKSCIELGHERILARFAQDLSLVELQILELEENIKRSDLPWQDIVRSVEKIHTLYSANDSLWNQTLTAEAAGLTIGTVSMYLTVGEFLSDENVQRSGTVREAYNLLLRRRKRAEGDALQELLEDDVLEPMASPLPDPMFNLPMAATAEQFEELERQLAAGLIPANVDFTQKIFPTILTPTQPALPGFSIEPILAESALEFIPKYDGKKFNLIHCDFPYGIDLFSSNGIRTGSNRSQMGRDEGEAYADTEASYRDLVECLASNIDRIASVSCHIMFWFSNKWEIEQWTRETFARLAPSISWSRFPLIWLKSDNAGIASSPQYEPRHVYETCLLGSRGRRNIVKLKADAYSAPTDKSLHTSAKPEPMLRHFMEMLVDESTSLFDPTCGSGTSLRAAESLGASRVLGLEINPDMAGKALAVLKNERAKRRLAREL